MSVVSGEREGVTHTKAKNKVDIMTKFVITAQSNILRRSRECQIKSKTLQNQKITELLSPCKPLMTFFSEPFVTYDLNCSSQRLKIYLGGKYLRPRSLINTLFTLLLS